MSGVISRWLGGVEALPVIAERLLRVQIENRPAKQVIELYDSNETLFYCDPPYIHDTRGDSKAYGNEMTDHDHTELADVLNSVKGMVAISNYDCKLMQKLYPKGKWTKIAGPEKTIHSTKDTRIEVLWTNFDPREFQVASKPIIHGATVGEKSLSL
jgi:DNA adenine methylase